MPQNSNYDPATGKYHADPNWKRYDPKYNKPLRPADIGVDPGTPIDVAFRLPSEMAGVVGDIGSSALRGLSHVAALPGYRKAWDMLAKDPHSAGVSVPSSAPPNAPRAPQTPYERQVAGFETPSMRADYGSDRFTANEPPLPPPPRPNLGAPPNTFPSPDAGRSTYGDIPGAGASAVEGLQSALGTGLEARAPFVRPGALSPQGAVDVFKASQPAPAERFVPGKMELARLAARKDIPAEGGGLEYGVAPGSSEMWGGELAKILSAEQFNTPEAEAAREMEMYKIGGPERTARVAGQYDVDQQREASRGNLAVTESKGGITQDFMNMMNQAAVAGRDVSRVSAPGIGSVSYAQPKSVPTGLLTQATAAYNNYVNAKSNSWFGSDADEELAVYKSTLGQALGMDNSIPDTVKPDIMQMLTDPELLDLPVGELDFSDYAYDPNLQAAIVNAIIKVRGK